MTARKRRYVAPIVSGTVLVLLFARIVHAASVTFAFRGTVNTVYNDYGVKPGELPTVGDRFAGTYTFDPADAPPGPFGGRLGQRVDGSVGNLRFTGEEPELTVEESPGSGHDFYRVSGFVRLLPPPASASDIEYWVFDLSLWGSDALLPGPGLSAVPPRLEFAEEKTFGLYGDSSWNVGPLPLVGIEATPDSLTVAPEPAAAAMCAAALLVLSRRSRNGQRAWATEGGRRKGRAIMACS